MNTIQDSLTLQNTEPNDMDGRICVVTGANRGIGKAIAQGLADLRAHVVLVCRNEERGRAAMHEISQRSGNPNVELMLCDLASQNSIELFCEDFIERYHELHVLVHNAAIIKKAYTETDDGIERTFAVNHLAPFLMNNLLFEMLINSDRARVITISSMVHKWGKIDLDDLNHKNNYHMDRAYNQSKLANILFTKELAERFAGTPAVANSMEPGMVKTEIGNEYSGFKRLFATRLWKPLMKEPIEGARTAIYLASDPGIEGISGRHYVDCKNVDSSRESQDPVLANRLWEASAELVDIPADIRPILSN